MNKTEKKEKIDRFAAVLEELYPGAECALEWGGEDWKLMVMGTLSAQCTDARVNLVCRDLFAKYPTAKDLAHGELSGIESVIRSCGLYRTKAKNIQGACRMLVEDYGGTVPDKMEDLLKLPGVGRKVANLLLGDLYGNGGIVADTHCIRVCGRFGMYAESVRDPVKVEREMNNWIAPEQRSAFCHRIVLFGRDVCTARSPKCETCPAGDFCAKNRK